MNPPRIRHLILDWSGTLVNDLPPVWQTTNHVLRHFGLPEMSLEEFRREFCLPIRHFYRTRLPAIPQQRLEAVFLREFHRVHEQITLLPHTLEFLEYCRVSGLSVFIASTVDPVTYERQARRLGVDRYITRPYIGIADKTEQIHHILEENRLAPPATLFVGDMEHDIAAGKAGGVRTCAVLTGYNLLDKLQAAGPDWICEHLGELQERLQQHGVE